MSNNKNNGLITKIWGPSGWEFLHSVTFGYPINPTEEQKINYKNFFYNIGEVLPCKFCRNSYKDFINNEIILTDKDLENRESLTKWFFNLHNRVNKKLKVEYNTKYEDIVERYESYRSKCGKIDKKKKGCITPLNLKSSSYKIANYKESPFIPVDLSKKFIKYAKLRNLDNEHFKFLNLCKNKNNITKISDNNDNICINRNIYTRNIINKMREEGIPSIETEGKYIGLPTVDETKLILSMSSNLNLDELKDISEKLPGKKYKLVN